MFMKCLISAAISLIGIVISLPAYNLLATAITNQPSSQQMTLLRSPLLGERITHSCSTLIVPDAYRQYCDNVIISKVGWLMLKMEPTKDVPDNPYISNLDHTVVHACRNCLYNSVIPNTAIEGSQTASYLLIGAEFLVIWSLLGAVIYQLFLKSKNQAGQPFQE
jgi:hypothetical protein